jgi:5-methyltetrahydrofolate--homocysteine methyltransferase
MALEAAGAALCRAVVEYRAAEAEDAARRALREGMRPADVVAALSEGMREIGHLWNTLDVFLPEVMAAVDAYYAGLSIARPALGASGQGDALATIIFGTIYGDIHTIGKDVAVPVFEAENFKVVDLGVDVSAERYVAAIREHRAHVVGLGTYMSETFLHVDDLIRRFEEAGVRDQVLVVCGGPAVDASTARRMGADDAYNDAWVAVERVKGLLRERGVIR